MGAARMENRLEEAFRSSGSHSLFFFFKEKASDILIETVHQEAQQVVSACMPVPGFQQQ